MMRILIDTDPAIGIPFKDIDDGLAMLFLFASPEVSMGAESKNSLGKRNPAVDFLIETVRKNPKEITLLALAPLTNVATAMMLDDKFANNLQNLIIMGGSLGFRPFSFFGEFNFHKDGRATSIVISSPIPKTLITMDICSQAVFKKEHLEKMRPITRKGGFYPWDVVAAAHLINASLFDKNPFTLKIQEKGIQSGKIYNLIKQDNFLPQNNIVPINIPLRLDAKRFMDLFMSRLLKL